MDVYLCARNEKENAALKKFCVGYLIQKNHEAEIYTLREPEALRDVVAKSPLINLFMIDTGSKVIQAAEVVQSGNPGNYIVLIGSEITALMRYITPRIRPAGIIIKPVKGSELTGVLNEVWADYESTTMVDSQFVFAIQAERFMVPYNRILTFESADKKIILSTENQEYEFYGSMQKIIESLPEYFLRVHRSFIVNMNHVMNVDFAENTLYLDDDSSVMISRNNRKTLLDYLERVK